MTPITRAWPPPTAATCSQAAVCRTRPPPSDHIPVYIQALMADQAKSLFGRSTKVFTTLQDVTGWVDRLRKQDIGSLVLSLYGFEQEDTAAEKRAAISWRAASAAKKELEALYGKLNVPGSGLLLSRSSAAPMKTKPKIRLSFTRSTGSLPPPPTPVSSLAAATISTRRRCPNR